MDAETTRILFGRGESCLMLARFHVDGMLGKLFAVKTLTGLLGHPPRRYRDLATELAQAWRVDRTAGGCRALHGIVSGVEEGGQRGGHGSGLLLRQEVTAMGNADSAHVIGKCS